MTNRGLHPDVRAAAWQTLADCLRIWNTLEAKDVWLALRAVEVKEQPNIIVSEGCQVASDPLGKGWTYSYSVEKRRSSIAQSELLNRLRSLPSVASLEVAIKAYQPELLSAIVFPSIARDGIEVAEIAVAWWSEALAKASYGELNEAIFEQVLDDLDKVLSSRCVTYEVTYLLGGIEFSETFEQIDLGDGWTLRRVAKEEIVSLASEEVLSRGSGSFPVLVKAALTYRKEYLVEFLSAIPSELPPFDLSGDLLDQSDLIVAALHLLKPCHIRIIRTTPKYVPTVLPGLTAWSHRPFDVSSPQTVKYSEDELLKFVDLYRRVITTGRREVVLAISRLRDAELRLNPFDSIVDAFIGIEAILNPVASTEISFTASLAYALLGPPFDRLSRFNELYKLYGVRSKIVHGAVAHGIGASIKFQSDAWVARKCLRDLLHRVLLDDQFVRGAKYDKKYWAEKLLQS